MATNKTKTLSDHSQDIIPRKGCKDIWNAFMVNRSVFELNSDMPICSCEKIIIPTKLTSYDDAKSICNDKIKTGDPDFHMDSYIHFYIDDYKFDGKKSSIWLYPNKALDIIRHFSGIITPDFSTNADFPDPIKRYNTYRMRTFGCWMNQLGIPVINNVRWGTPETWTYCFDGIPKRSIISIGTVGGNPRKLIDRDRFVAGIDKMVEVLEPQIILVYGSAKYPCFEKLKKQGIKIISYPSKTSMAFAEVKR